MRVQPDESIYMLTVAKEPGIAAEQVRKPVVMDMSYDKQFADAYNGDAYERTLHGSNHNLSRLPNPPEPCGFVSFLLVSFDCSHVRE